MLDQPAVHPDLDGALRLPDWGLIRAEGDEASRFLQGQLTQDIEHLDTRGARLAGYCSPKGRLLATFVAWRDEQPPAVWLAASADLLPPTLKRLSMYVLRARCRLTDASAQRPLWGLAGLAATRAFGPAAADLAVWGRTGAAGGDLLRLPDALADGVAVARHLWAAPAGGESATPTTFGTGDAAPAQATSEAVPPAASLPLLDVGVWRWLEVMSGVPRIAAVNVEQFVPQMVNLEVVGGVDFRKGCYPGQEVVARSQYRGTLKRRAWVMETPALLPPGTDLFDPADPAQPAGRVVLSGSRSADRHAALVEAKLSALADGASLRAGDAQGPALTPLALPYALPAAEPA